jgi:16S rRNA (cytosine1402-N4)-methyltransferase
LVKNLFRESARQCDCPPAYGSCVCGADPKGRVVHRRVLRASEDEVRANSRAKAARLRVFEKSIEAGR